MRHELGPIYAAELGKDYLRLFGRKNPTKYIGPEPTEPGYGYDVHLYILEGDKEKDLARAVVHPNSTTPPELVARDGFVADYPIKGRGTFTCWTPERGLERIRFDENDPSNKYFGIYYGRGTYQFWSTEGTPLEILEICSPPYQPGDLPVLEMATADVPEEFRDAWFATMNK